jgi:uncharacterized protein
MRATAAKLLALPVVLAGGAGLLPGVAKAPQGDDLVEMEVAGVAPLEDDQAGLLLLREKGGDAVLPLVVGRAEATAIELALRKAVPPRPLTHDLLDRAIGELGGKVVRVEIDGLRESVFLAKVRLAQGHRRLALDARPSDSVALALRTRSPIYASRKVIDAAAGSRPDLQKKGKRGQGAETRPAPPFEGTQQL